MKRNHRLLLLLVLSLPALGCGGFFDFAPPGRVVVASGKVVQETREVSGFDAVDMRGIGKLVIDQNGTESLEISGPENVLPLVKTSVRGGTLIIDLERYISVTGMHPANMLTFTVGVKDLSSLIISGLADAEMDGLTASKLRVTMSGSGRISLSGLDLDDLRLTLSGLGDSTFSGAASSAVIDISGAGNVDAADLEIQTADISVSGAGNASLWVTETLTGSISGVGNVEYYGEPATRTHTSGVGFFRSMGTK